MLYGCIALFPIENEAFPNADAGSDVIITEESPVDGVELQKQLNNIKRVQSVYSPGGYK